VVVTAVDDGGVVVGGKVVVVVFGAPPKAPVWLFLCASAVGVVPRQRALRRQRR